MQDPASTGAWPSVPAGVHVTGSSSVAHRPARNPPRLEPGREHRAPHTGIGVVRGDGPGMSRGDGAWEGDQRSEDIAEFSRAAGGEDAKYLTQ